MEGPGNGGGESFGQHRSFPRGIDVVKAAQDITGIDVDNGAIDGDFCTGIQKVDLEGVGGAEGRFCLAGVSTLSRTASAGGIAVKAWRRPDRRSAISSPSPSAVGTGAPWTVTGRTASRTGVSALRPGQMARAPRAAAKSATAGNQRRRRRRGSSAGYRIGGLEAIGGPRSEALRHNAVPGFGKLSAPPRLPRTGQHLFEGDGAFAGRHLLGRMVPGCGGAGEHLVKDYAERIEIRSHTERLAVEQFRRHVIVSAGRAAEGRAFLTGRLEAGQSEIGNDGADGAFGRLREDHVGGLQIAVDHALAMRLGETGAELQREIASFAWRQGTVRANMGEQRLALEEFHTEEFDFSPRVWTE